MATNADSQSAGAAGTQDGNQAERLGASTSDNQAPVVPPGTESRIWGQKQDVDLYKEPGFVLRSPQPHPDGRRDDCDVDFVIVSGIGAHPIDTWRARKSHQQNRPVIEPSKEQAPTPTSRELWKAAAILSAHGASQIINRTLEHPNPPWVTADLRKSIPNARVLVYNHGQPEEGVTLKSLALKLLDNLLSERPSYHSVRPLFFIAHSTGGLVVKQALIEAQGNIKYMQSCYGATFFATPHHGSTYLSSPAFARSMQKSLSLIWPLPNTVQRELRLYNILLETADQSFRDIAADLQISTFTESVDTLLSFSDDNERRELSAPIVTLRSAMLDVHHEVHNQLLNDHAHCAAFEGDDSYQKSLYLANLEKAVQRVASLFPRGSSVDLDLLRKVHIEVHGFYTKNNEVAMNQRESFQMWSTRVLLGSFLKKGPSQCLHDRFSEIKPHAPPSALRTTKLITSRAEPLDESDGPTLESQMDPMPMAPFFEAITPTSATDSSAAEANGPATSNDSAKKTTESLIWVHLPYNNPHYVADVLRCIERQTGDSYTQKLLGRDNWQRRHVLGHSTEYHACFVRPGCTCLVSDFEAQAQTGSMPTKQPTLISLYFPYLHWDSYKRMIKRRDIIKERILQGRSEPAPLKVARFDMETKVAWKYLGYDPPFNCARTLDQYGYPDLLDPRHRDDYQILYRRTQEKIPNPSDWKFSRPRGLEAHLERIGEIFSRVSQEFEAFNAWQSKFDNILDGKVLMVEQVWLWVPDTGAVASFFPSKEATLIGRKHYHPADLRNNVFNEINSDMSRRCENSLDLAGLIVLNAVTLLFEGSSPRDVDVFRIYEESISIIIEHLTLSFKYFKFGGLWDTNDKNDVLRPRERRKADELHYQKQIRDNISSFMELREIEDDLQKLERLFKEQSMVIRDMKSVYDRLQFSKSVGMSYLLEASTKLNDYLYRIEQLMKSAGRARDDLEKLRNIDEGRLSRLQADLQAEQSKAVMIFTIFTIIFLPLSFFTGIFGMNTREWAGQSTMVPLATIVAISLPISTIIICGALTLALSTRFHLWARSTGETILNFRGTI